MKSLHPMASDISSVFMLPVGFEYPLSLFQSQILLFFFNEALGEFCCRKVKTRRLEIESIYKNVRQQSNVNTVNTQSPSASWE